MNTWFSSVSVRIELLFTYFTRDIGLSFLIEAFSVSDPSLASKTSITLEELALHPFLMREKGSAGREILDAYFSLKDIHIHPLWESSSTQAIVQGVAMGLGVSVLPEMMIKKDILEHRVSYLSFPKPLKRNLNLILHRNKHLTKNMKSFIEYCMLYSEK